ncbi:uncharacterized protein [Zea mays]|jgi:hypothetical protein|uniref:uncharacterized protein n=1 Tax=Zea mays TaxID=4577 RepID=UPI0009A976FC|nr:uncharacterized protein LOC109944586 [Zea mays]|eukprot:XP_020404947.1 uncharacterized protein LOC109944586 [Zea mays]
MDTVASWRLLSPPPCPQQLPKRQATFAASPRQHSASSSSAKFRLLCHLHLHDKIDTHIATNNLALVSLPLPATSPISISPTIPAAPRCLIVHALCSVSRLLLGRDDERAASGVGAAELAAAEAGNGATVRRRLGSCTYRSVHHCPALQLGLIMLPAGIERVISQMLYNVPRLRRRRRWR